MQSCRFFFVFFSPDVFMKISNFSKTVQTNFIKFYSHSTPKGAPVCSKASKSYEWNVRNIAKLSPKMAKISPKTANFRFFFDFLKNCPYDWNEILYSPSTLYYGPLCVISSNSYCWDVRNIAKINQKIAKKQPVFDFLISAKTVHTIRTKVSTVIFYNIVWSMRAISINSYNWDWSESRKNN